MTTEITGQYDIVTVSKDEDDVQIEFHAKDTREMEGYTYLTSEQADAVAIALIQASLGEGLDAQDVQYFSSESPESRLKIGLALIRSAK